MLKQTNVLILGVHDDDPEYGVGGIAALLAKQKCKVTIATLKKCAEPKVAGRIRSFKEADAPNSVRCLGLSDKIEICVYARGDILYNEDTIDAYRTVVEMYQPEIAFIMWPKDNHPEHVAGAKAQLMALTRYATNLSEIYAYEVGPLQSGCHFGMPDISVDISSTFLSVMETLSSWPMSEDGVQALQYEKETSAKYRGHCAYAISAGMRKNFLYAEPLKIIKFPQAGNDFLLRSLLEGSFRWGGVNGYVRGEEHYF